LTSKALEQNAAEEMLRLVDVDGNGKVRRLMRIICMTAVKNCLEFEFLTRDFNFRWIWMSLLQ
jgi:hypothetical protein